MELSLIVGVLLAIVFLLLGSGTFIAVALGLTGVILSHFVFRAGSENYIALGSWLNVASFLLTPIPLFVFMGEILFHSRVSQELFAAGSAWLGRLPGGLLHSNIAACTVFAACSGSSVATAATIGTVAIPDLTKRGYQKKMIFGSLAGGGTLGLLIPPSISLIVYGALVGESIGRLFIAGVFPGIVLSAIFMSYILLRCLVDKTLVPATYHASWKERLMYVRKLWTIGVVIFLVLGSIYLGIATPTESAALGVMASLAFCAMRRKLNFLILREALFASVRTTAMIMFIVAGAMFLAYVLAILRIPAQIAEWVFSMNLSPIAVLVLITILYVFLGCLLEAISMMVLTLPVVFPVITGLGFDPIWFGVYLTVLTEMAQITPPVGMNLFVLHGIDTTTPLGDIIAGAFPYVILMFILLAVLVAVPDLALWLPARMN